MGKKKKRLTKPKYAKKYAAIRETIARLNGISVEMVNAIAEVEPEIFEEIENTENNKIPNGLVQIKEEEVALPAPIEPTPAPKVERKKTTRTRKKKAVTTRQSMRKTKAKAKA